MKNVPSTGTAPGGRGPGTPPAERRDAIAAVLSWWVGRVTRVAWLVVIASVIATGYFAVYTVRHLGIQTSTDEMISGDLGWRKLNAEFDRTLPHQLNNIVVVVTAPNADLARDGATRLARRLSERSDIFNFVLYPPAEPYFSENAFLFMDVEDLDLLSARLADAQPLLGALAEDPSLRGLFDILARASTEIAKGRAPPGSLDRVLSRIADVVQARLKGHPTGMSWVDLIRGEQEGPAAARQVIVVQPNPDYRSMSPADQAMDLIRTTAASLHLTADQGYSVRLTGSLAIEEEELESVSRSGELASLISLVLVGIVAFVALRSGRLLWSTLAVLLVGLIWTAFFATVAIGRLNLISISFAVLYLGLSIDFGIQLGLRYREVVDSGETGRKALRDAVAGVGPAILLAMVTALIGFFSFVPTAYVGLAELGIISGVGIAIAVFLYLTLFPALLATFPVRPRSRRGETPGNGMARVLGWFERYRRPVVIVSALLTVASFAALPYIRFEFDPLRLKDPSTESVQTYFDLAEDSDTSLYTISVLAPTRQRASALAQRLERLPEVDRVVTLASFVPRNQDVKLSIIDGMNIFMAPVFHGTDPEPPPTPAERRQSVQAFRAALAGLAASPNAGEAAAPARRLADLLGRVAGPAELRGLKDDLLGTLPNRLAELKAALNAHRVTVQDIPEDLRSRYVSTEGRYNVEVYPAKDLSEHRALEEFVHAVRSVAPNATDTPVVLVEAGKTVTDAFKKAAAITTVLVVALLILVLRRVADAALVLAPIFMAAMLTLAATVVFGIPFNFANMIAIPLMLALGVAFGIYLILRHRETRSVSRLLQTNTPKAVFYSGLTTMCSFGSLIIYDHRGMASMGYLLVISLTLALVCSLVVLPALLGWRESAAEERPPAHE